MDMGKENVMRTNLGPVKRGPHKRQKGIIMLMFGALLVFIVIPIVGLAIDVGILYAIKAKLQTATDGAALAAARGLSRGLSLDVQKASAKQTAERFFHANMPNKWMGMTPVDPVVTFPPAPPKTTIVKIDSSVVAPTYFMRIMGKYSVTLRANGAANRRDVNIMMVIDRSGSLGANCPALKSAAISFVDSFVDGRDKLGLITFGTTYRTDFALATDFKSRGGGNDLITLINNVNCVGGTNAGVAYWNAYQQLNLVPEPGALNVILFFTDGVPTAVHHPAIPINAASSCTNKTAKNAVITTGGSSPWGLNLPVETNPPGTVPNPDWRAVSGSGGCYYAGGTAPSYRFSSVSTDVPHLGPYATGKDVNNISFQGWKNLTTSSGNISITSTNINNMASNVLDNASQLVRTQSVASGLDVLTFTIGLGTVDEVLLNRVANTSAATNYNPSHPKGTYVFAANAAQLQQAFAQLASDILRLSI
jgi:hypothetical protein